MKKYIIHSFILTIILPLLFLFPTVTYSGGTPPELRVTDGIIAYYDFQEKSGTVIKDRSNVLPRLDLTITDPSKITFLEPGIRVNEATIIKTNVLRDKFKLETSKFFTDGITIETWVKPLNNTQSGPARIITFSVDSGNRNFTLGQSGSGYDQRFRTSATNSNGSDILAVTPKDVISITPELQHVVYTRDISGNAKIYLDSVEVGSATVTGDGSTWDFSYNFGFFNELNYPVDDRTWLGDMYIAAIYKKALSPEEISQNFNAGYNAQVSWVTLAWDANTEPNLKGYRVHFGKDTRFKESHILEHEARYKVLTDEFCGTNTTCADSWNFYCICKTYQTVDGKSVCIEEDPPEITTDYYCDRDYFPYEYVIDVGKVEEFTIYNLDSGSTYYLAGAAYNDQFDPNYKIILHESKYSIELTHVAGIISKPTGLDNVINLRWQVEE